MAPRPLPRAPTDAIGPEGPRLGRHAGWLGRADLSSLSPPGLLDSLRHALRERRWQRALLCGRDHLVLVHLEDGGPLASGLLWVVEQGSGRVLVEQAAVGLPGVSGQVGDRPGAGARASFAATGLTLALERRSDRFQLDAAAGEVRLAATLDTRGAPDPQALVALTGEDGLRVAQVSGPLALGGWLEVAGVRHRLEGGAAALDFASAVLPAAAAWRRLTAISPAGAPSRLLHLAAGPDTGAAARGPGDHPGESVLLGPGGPVPLPPVILEPAAEPGRWHATGGGGLALTFRAAAIHREARERLGRSSQRTFLVGTLAGRLPAEEGGFLEVGEWPAMAEDFASGA